MAFRSKVFPIGEQAVEWARTHNPTLIILSVEPRKVGYAICNKLKRSPSMREIPLVLISAEETMATFEQHKKLKSRAEEYLLKPLDMTELLAMANRLVDLGDTQIEAQVPESDSGEIEIADDEIAEVSLDDDALLEEEGAFSAGHESTAREPLHHAVLANRTERMTGQAGCPRPTRLGCWATCRSRCLPGTCPGRHHSLTRTR